MALRILQLGYEYPPLVVGGMAAHLQGLSEALAAQRHEVVVFSRAHADEPADSIVNGVRVMRTHHDLPWTPESQPIAEVLNANHHLSKLADRMGDWRPDVVHAHDWLSAWSADTLASRFQVPMVATIHATERGRQQGWLSSQHSYGVNAAEWWLTYQANDVICCSQFMADEIRDGFSPPADKLHVIPNGIDADWHVDVEPLEFALPKNAAVIVAWGRHVYEKGFQTALDAMVEVRKSVPNAVLVIAGRGPHSQSLRAHAEMLQLHDEVLFPGFVSTPQLASLLKRAQCAVIPSYYEPFGMVALEALSAGVPTVVSATGGLREVIGDHPVAHSIPPADITAMAKAIVATLENASDSAAMAARGAAYARSEFGWDRVAKETVDVYAGSIAKRTSHNACGGE